MSIRSLISTAAVMAALTSASQAVAETKSVEISIKDHLFSPAEVKVPANQKVKLIVKNLDATPEEFESHDMDREKIIPGNSTATILVGPLKPGTYSFFGEFNEKTAQGKVIAE